MVIPAKAGIQGGRAQVLAPLVTRPLWLDLIAAAVLGVGVTLGFPPFDFKPLPLFAIAALLAIAARHSWQRAALIGMSFGIAHFTSGIYWIYISTHIYGGAPAWLSVLLCLALFSYMSLYFALMLGIAARLKLFDSAWGYAGLPALWLLGELLRGWVWSGFPWLALGGVALDTPLQSLAPVLGVHGLSAIIVLMAFAVRRAVMHTRRTRWISGAIALTPLLIAHVLPAPGNWTQDTGEALTAAIIQGNIEQDKKWLPEMQGPTLLRYHQMTQAALDADIIVWPEVALAQPYHVLRENYLDPLAAQLREHNAALLFGTLIRRPDGAGYNNSVLGIGSAQGRYDKYHLVPFGEYFPIPAFLRPMMDVLEMKYSDFNFGDAQQPPIMVQQQPMGLYICFEDVFAGEFARNARDDSVLVNVTNDAWFGHSGAAEQHMQMARLRALETGRPMLRASNTGRSAVIEPDGRIQASAGFFTTETLRGTVQPRAGLTPFMRWSHVPLWIFSVVTLMFLIARVAKPILRR